MHSLSSSVSPMQPTFPTVPSMHVLALLITPRPQDTEQDDQNDHGLNLGHLCRNKAKSKPEQEITAEEVPCTL